MSMINELNLTVNETGGDSSPLELNSDEDSKLTLFVLWGVILPLVAIAGLVGNILTILVLWRREMHSTTVMYMRGMVITDTGILIGSVITLTPLSCANYLHSEALEYIRIVVYPIIHTPGYYIIMTLQQCNVWITVSVSMERYIAICHPFRAARIITRRKTIIVLISIALISLIYNIPHLMATRATPCGASNVTNTPIEINPTLLDNSEDLSNVILTSTPSAPISLVNAVSTVPPASNCLEVTPTEFGLTQFYITYRSIMYSIIIYVIPFLALLILNSFLIKELMTMQQRRSGTNIHEENEANLSLVLVLIVIVFIFCQTPGLISQFDHNDHEAFVQWLGVSNLLFTTNSAVNFLIYTAFGRKFRRVLLLLFRHIFQKNRRQSQSSSRTTQYTIGDSDAFGSPTVHCASLNFTTCYRKENKINGDASENIPLNTVRDKNKTAFNGAVQNVKYNNGGKRTMYTNEEGNCERGAGGSSGALETVSLVRGDKSVDKNETTKMSQLSGNSVPNCDDNVATKAYSTIECEQPAMTSTNNAAGEMVTSCVRVAGNHQEGMCLTEER